MGNELKAATPNDRSGEILVSFSSRWEEKIMGGGVKVVFRKKIPATFTPTRMYIYVGVPLCKIIAISDVVKAEFVDHGVALSLKDEGGISKKELLEYIGDIKKIGIYHIDNIFILEKPISMDYLIEKYDCKPPQSFFALSTNGSELLKLETSK